MQNTLSRRGFIKTTGGLGLGLATAGAGAFSRFSPNEQVNVLSVGVVGSIGGTAQLLMRERWRTNGLLGSQHGGHGTKARGASRRASKKAHKDKTGKGKRPASPPKGGKKDGGQRTATDAAQAPKKGAKGASPSKKG